MDSRGRPPGPGSPLRAARPPPSRVPVWVGAAPRTPTPSAPSASAPARRLVPVQEGLAGRGEGRGPRKLDLELGAHTQRGAQQEEERSPPGFPGPAAPAESAGKVFSTRAGVSCSPGERAGSAARGPAAHSSVRGEGTGGGGARPHN